MSQLSDTLKAIREDNLDLPTLEKLRDTLIHLKTDMGIEIAQHKKERALFLLASTEESAIAKKIAWEGSEAGQRLIELQGYMQGLAGEIDALMSRIYSAIR